MLAGYLPFFAQNPLDRMDNYRSDISFIKDIDVSNHRFLVLYNNDILTDIKSGNYFLSVDEIVAFKTTQKIFLGSWSEKYYFVITISDINFTDYKILDLRSLVDSGLIANNIAGILAQAVSVVKWHSKHSFCSNCGNKTTIDFSGWRRSCLKCGTQHFPRVDPVVIMLVTKGDSCLLGAGHDFAPNRYSCLAGFMEPGETIEDAARRELFEEVGIKGGRVNYITSQPWPFPSTLMIGVKVEINNMEININNNELRDARWFSRSDIKSALDGDNGLSFNLSSFIAIANTLLNIWVVKQDL